MSRGGLIDWLLFRLRIATDDGHQNRRRILILIGVTWLPLLILSAFEGTLIGNKVDLVLLEDFKPHVRFLLTLPLLIIADTVIDPLISTVIQNLDNSGVLAKKDGAKFQRALDALSQRKESFWADVIIIGITASFIWTYSLDLYELYAETKFTSWTYIKVGAEYQFTLAGYWILMVSTPLLLVLLFRWFWRFGLWIVFMYRVSRIELKLQASHADLSGGIGILKHSANAFVFLFLVFGTMLSVSIAQEIATSDFTLVDSRFIVLGFIVTSVLLVSIPLLFFSGQLAKEKIQGREFYERLGYRLSRAFREKWGNHEDPTTGEDLLKTVDSSSLTDYNAVFDTVNGMRIIPMDLKHYLIQVGLLLLPFVPLVFIELSITDIIKLLVDSLI